MPNPHRNSLLFLLLPLLASIFFFLPTDVFAIGITPASFDVKDILQNSSVPQTVYFSRRNPSQDEYVLVVITGTAAGYIKAPGAENFLLPKGLNNTPFIFTIEPGMLAPGGYNARLSVNQVTPLEENTATTSGSSSSILVGAETKIHFTVTGEALEQLAYENIDFQDTEINTAVPFSFKIVNSGNVDSRPSKIEVVITDDSNPSLVFKETVDENQVQIVKAFSNKDIFLLTQAKLPVGKYHATLSFYKQDKLDFTSTSLPFQVFPTGTLDQRGELVSFQSDKPSYENGEPVTFTGVFQNTGRLVANAALDIHILQNGKEIDLLRSEEVSASIRQSVTLQKIYHPLASGSYTAVAVAAFGIKKSNEIRLDFTVNEKIAPLNVYMILSILLLIILIIILIIRRIMKKKPPTPPSPIPPVPPAPPMEDPGLLPKV